MRPQCIWIQTGQASGRDYILASSTSDQILARKVRVLFVNTRSDLGADVAVHLMLIRHFNPESVEAHIATNRNSADLVKTLQALGDMPQQRVRVWDLGNEMSRSARGKAPKVMGAIRNLGIVTSVARLAWYVRVNKIDILHSTDRPRDALVSSLLSRLTGRPHVLHLHIMWYPEIGRWARVAVRRCAGVIAISEFVKRSLVTGGVPAEKIHTVLNATETVAFDPRHTERGHLRSSIGLCAAIPLIGIVARVILWKGHLELVEAMALVRDAIPDAHLAIIGKEDRPAHSHANVYGAQVRRRITELGLDDCVHWVGWRNDGPQVMADLDILAVPSWEEPFGLVVTEAMAMERPVVGFASGALPEIITAGVEGLLTAPRDPRALADSLISLLNDPVLRGEMGRRGRERVLRQFSPDRQAREMAAVYRRILSAESSSKTLR